MSLLKPLERWLRFRLRALLRRRSPAESRGLPTPVRRVLVYRLDEKIGNGILLLPLLRAIRASHPEAVLDLLVHAPVATLYRHCPKPELARILAWDQPVLLRRPWRLLTLLRGLRRRRYDIAVTVHTPGDFSVSQALLGRWLRPGLLVGFDGPEGSVAYDRRAPVIPGRPYREAVVDLWRTVDPAAVCDTRPMRLEGAGTPERGAPVLLWLGATGDKVLPADLLAFLYEEMRSRFDREVRLAAPAGDAVRLGPDIPRWVLDRLELWEGDLVGAGRRFRRHAVVVGGDTGPMHLAVALGCPTLTIFTRSDRDVYGHALQGRHYPCRWEGRPDDRVAISRVLDALARTVGTGQR